MIYGIFSPTLLFFISTENLLLCYFFFLYFMLFRNFLLCDDMEIEDTRLCFTQILKFNQSGNLPFIVSFIILVEWLDIFLTSKSFTLFGEVMDFLLWIVILPLLLIQRRETTFGS